MIDEELKITYRSPYGDMLLASDDEGLTGVWFVGQKYFASRSQYAVELSDLRSNDNDSFDEPSLARQTLGQAFAWLDQYFAGEEPTVDVPLHLIGSDFQREVWGVLLDVPYGKTITYGDIARRLAAKRGVDKISPQAVGGAVGRNPISIIVPCHRVVGAHGELTGYAAGVDKKAALLALEGRG